MEFKVGCIARAARLESNRRMYVKKGVLALVAWGGAGHVPAAH